VSHASYDGEDDYPLSSRRLEDLIRRVYKVKGMRAGMLRRGERRCNLVRSFQPSGIVIT